jgi:acyl carrier protein
MSSTSQHGQTHLARPISSAQIRQLVATLDTMIETKKLDDNTRFVDAGADSLDFFNIVAGIQVACDLDIPNADIEQVGTIQDMVAYLNQKLP